MANDMQGGRREWQVLEFYAEIDTGILQVPRADASSLFVKEAWEY